jgi:hypothetical protein
MKYGHLRIRLMLIVVTICTLSRSAFEGPIQAVQQNSPVTDQTPEFRPQLVPFEVQIMNPQARGGGIQIDFKGTNLMSNARGAVKAKSSRGTTSIKAEFENLESSTKFGEQNLVYVLWSMTREFPVKLGELALKDSRGRLDTSTALQTLALFATVEPYIEVNRPSNLVVLEQTMATTTPEANTGMTAKAELLRDGYAPIGYTFEPLNVGLGQPSIFRQALNARRIAQVARAEQHATNEFKQAEDLYQFVLSTVLNDKRPSTSSLKNAIAVIRSYENARAVSVRRQTERRPVN